MYKLEACVVSLQQAVEAEGRGADRMEICDRLDTGGLTPSPELVSAIITQLSIPVRVMIRSTVNGFEADAVVLAEMQSSIEEFKKLEIEGFVIGVMKGKRIDQDAMTLLCAMANPFPVTFHKAIDTSSSVAQDLRWLRGIANIDTLLTSGGAERAIDGARKILEMKDLFHGQIMAAGKITPGDLHELHTKLGLHWYHGRAIV